MPRMPHQDSPASRVGPLASVRERAGLTQDELAAKAGVSQSTVCRIENGENFASRATASLLRDALARCGQQVSILALMGLDDVG